MLSIQQPEDLISISIYNILSFRKDAEFYALVIDWNKTIIIDIIGFYPIAIFFEGNEIKFDMNIPKKFDLKVSMDINSMMDIAYGRLGAVMATLKRKIKIKGIYKIGVLLKFMKIFLKSMNLVATDPNINYYEVDKYKK